MYQLVVPQECDLTGSRSNLRELAMTKDNDCLTPPPPVTSVRNLMESHALIETQAFGMTKPDLDEIV